MDRVTDVAIIRDTVALVADDIDDNNAKETIRTVSDTIQGTKKLEAGVVTIQVGRVVYDLNGISFNPLIIEN